MFGVLRKIFFTALLACFCSIGFADTKINFFSLDSYQGIINSSNQKSFLMVLWSLDCPPCIDELQMLGTFHRQYPDKKIILVSTDSSDQVEPIMSLVNQFGLQDIDQWVFDYSSQHLRYSIDPEWYGELPRSYYHYAGKRLAFSGRLKHEQITSWFMGKEIQKRLD